MTRTRRALGGGLALVAGMALLTTACGSSGDDATTATTGPAVTEADGAEATAPAQTITIPLQVQAATSTDGAHVIVQASIGGGPTVPMLLDTGSSGVVVAASAVGSEAQTTSETTQIPYVGTTVDGAVANATVTMGSLSTAGPIQVTVAQSAECSTGSGGTESCAVTNAFGADVQGIIGIGLSDGPSPASPTYSPLLQVSAPYDEGFVVELPASGSGSGSLVVGPVEAPSGATAVPLVASTSPTYPNGATAFAKDVQLCWAVGSATACGATDLDIGMPATHLTPSVIPGVPVVDSDIVQPGSAVSVSPAQGTTPLWSFTAGEDVSSNLAYYLDDLGSATSFNTGIAFFFANAVGYDTAHSQLLVWPQGSSSANSAL